MTKTQVKDVEASDGLDDLVLGYPKLAGHVQRLPEVGIFRRFGALNARRLYYLQAELVLLEKELKELERLDKESGDKVRSQYSINWYWFKKSERSGDDAAAGQWRLMQRIALKLHEYNEALIQQTTITAMKEPGAYDLKDLQNYLLEIGLPLEGDDSDIWGSAADPLAHAPDLVTLRARQQEDIFSTWIVEKAVKRAFQCCQHRIKPSKVHGMKGYESQTFLRLTYWITSIIASILPSTFIIVLYCIKSTWVRLAVLAAFNLVVSICLTAFTTAKRSEVFAVTAAFAALQVVFIATNA